MSLSSSQLDAFFEVVQTSNFSKAARNLAITQSALSQRVKNLEDELGTILLIRDAAGIRLTSAGEDILQYCKNRKVLETEYLRRIHRSQASSLVGVIRVAGYSTLVRSIVLPTLAPFLALNSDIRIEIVTREIRELSRLLRTGETDYIFLDHALEKDSIESRLIGYEENILIESKKHGAHPDLFLDHDLDDDTTSRFFEIQTRKPKKIHRIFLDEIYGIIDGVALGLGRAVVPKHLIKNDARVRVVPDYKSLSVPIYLNYYKQPFYTQLQKASLEVLMKCGDCL